MKFSVGSGSEHWILSWHYNEKRKGHPDIPIFGSAYFSLEKNVSRISGGRKRIQMSKRGIHIWPIARPTLS